MDALKIRGNGPLTGIIDISGSKNATLPIMAATILAAGESRLGRVPDLADVRTLQRVLAHLGIDIKHEGKEITLDATNITEQEAPYDLVRTMRASILVLGPLLARFGRARVSLPGGCAIGARPIDQHLKGLKKLGAKITLEHGYVEATAEKLVGAEIIFDMPTVGGTEHLMIAASLAEGTTVLRNAAREPEIVDLAVVLKKMGADITGEGTERITIVGQKSLKPFVHDVVADRIEFGTFLIAGAMIGENLTLRGGVIEHQTALLDKIKQSGAKISINDEAQEITVSRADKLEPVNIKTAPYPGFPTDMQAQMMTLLCQAEGTSVITETIFENRFMHVAELGRLGAKIRVDGGKAIVSGGEKLRVPSSWPPT
uniref:UDP-N-acetylglucosamine 1-carboxyvinyltransferase n=1 Tax=uncultured organism MedDCM-OCT-S11-C346 TaxID=743660 RepID=D6PLF1_9ZZZZ|nr:UDP N acetylglucosamine 1 carboxyvinyltransferase [uncultured organism MedDCM-OCT-S11-C346]